MKIWIAVLVLYSDGDASKLESVIYAPTKDGCELEVDRWINMHMALMEEDVTAWVDAEYANCAPITIDEPRIQLAPTVPPPPMTPERSE